jgi:hypothetical protein
MRDRGDRKTELGTSTVLAESQDWRRDWGRPPFFAGRIAADSRRDGEKVDCAEFTMRKPNASGSVSVSGSQSQSQSQSVV